MSSRFVTSDELAALDAKVDLMADRMGRLEAALERQNSLVMFLLKSVTELRERSTVPASPPQPTPLDISFENYDNLFYIGEMGRLVRSSSSGDSSAWRTALSAVPYIPELNSRLEVTFALKSAPNSNIMLGVVPNVDVQRLRSLTSNAFVGRVGNGFHCRNGKMCERNIFKDCYPQCLGLATGDTVTIIMHRITEGKKEVGQIRVRCDSQRWPEKVLVENCDFGGDGWRFAISLPSGGGVGVEKAIVRKL